MDTLVPPIDRLLAKGRAEEESRRADMKQHADKLIQGFEKLEESHAKRAIWELFQNAIDLSDKSEITIKLNESNLTFEHNGRPFTSNTLSCLIKQVSSKNAKNNEDEVGQYGTGFITTHSFGKRILITGSMKEGEYFIPLDEFEIDRIAPNADPGLIDKLLIQQKWVFELVEKGELTTNCRPFTAFAYQSLSTLEKQNAERAVASLETILPYVMVINEKLQKVTVIDKSGDKTIYSKGQPGEEKGLTFTCVFINGEEKKLYFLRSEAEEMIIILPLEDRNNAILMDDNLSRLFLFYPLIGTEHFGFNYIVHSRQFAPTEPRDGIHLKSKNEQVQEKEMQNRVLMERALSLISAFVEKHCEEISNVEHLAYANFVSHTTNPLLSEYLKATKEEWSKSFKNYRLVAGNTDRQTPQNTCFLGQDLLCDEKYLDAVYYIASCFWTNMPKREIAKVWTDIVTDWQNDAIKFITITDILKKIEAADSITSFSDPKQLERFYEYLIQLGHGDVFNQYRLLPNIKGEFRKQSQLSIALNIDDALIRIADIIIPDVPKRYIMQNFQLSLSFEPYDRKQFSRDLNAQIAEHNKAIKSEALLPRHILLGIVEYCKLFSSLENTATRGLLTKSACEYYEVDATFRQLPTLTNQEIDWLPAMKCLLRNLIWDLNSKNAEWLEQKQAFLENLISAVCDYYEFDDIIETLPLYPNQHFRLCKRSELKLDGGIPDELKELYDDIAGAGESIRMKLFFGVFGKYAKAPEIKMPKTLGESIEEVFVREKPLEVNEHPHKKEIIGIIKRISDDESWAEFFPKINDKKATIMMARISDEETKNDLFSILGLEKEQIALLGELSRLKDFEQIINKGKEGLEEEHQRNADFRFKHTIGTHIEKLVREKIGASLVDFKVNVREKQGGQDIVVEYSGEIVYYVEVKSRWDSRNSITVSALQMRKAVENKDIYALCCVDMVTYKIGDPERYNVEDIAIILDRISVINDIGGKFEPLLSGALAVKDLENEISLSGDYRGTVPQAVVQKGDRLDAFVTYLITKLRLI